jgi:hypothetical protein
MFYEEKKPIVENLVTLALKGGQGPLLFSM